MYIEQQQQRKNQIRSQIRNKRRGLSIEFQQECAEALCRQIQTTLKPDMNVALYVANDGELSPHVLIEQAKILKLQVLLPVLHPTRKGYLNFQRLLADTEMITNQYGIHEPKWSSSDTVPLDEIDLICMPLVAFDAAGNRLGMGGGYYDRTLSRLHELNHPPKLIGLAHDIQQIDNLPTQPWDIPISIIITPNQVIDAST